MQKVKILKPGDTVGIAAPAGQINRQDLLRGISEIKRLGYQVYYTDDLFSSHYYFAGSHQQRAQNLLDLFANPKVKAIFCARGGYGCQYLLGLLDIEALRANPKIFLGYSDITVLLQFLENNCNMVCFHGPMVSKEFALGKPHYSKESLQGCLSRTGPGQRLHFPQTDTLRPGKARGKLTGGCLSLLTAGLGTRYELRSTNKILFLEDINVQPYQVDRMLTQLRLAGKLEGVRAFIFGEMLNCTKSAKAFSLQEVIFNILKGLEVPIWYGLPSGHTSTGALTLPFGVEISLDTGEKWFQVEESAVVEEDAPNLASSIPGLK